MPLLTPGILALEEYGLEIITCDDMLSYKKIIPAIELYPDSYIVTADDDVFYEKGWLSLLTETFDPANPAIIARRAHRPARNANGELRPYAEWAHSVVDQRPSKTQLFPTGVGGVLYPPGSLSPEAADRATFMKLCPHGDDIWLYWMGRRANSTYRQVGPFFRAVEWDGAHETSLFQDNWNGRNDIQLKAMHQHFGPV